MYCSKCGTQIDGLAAFCPKCGSRTAVAGPAGEVLRSKLAAGLLGIFLGSWGIHRFYLGFVGMGVVQIIVTLVTFGIGGLWGFIEGILILTGSFDKDAKGQPLRD